MAEESTELKRAHLDILVDVIDSMEPLLKDFLEHPCPGIPAKMFCEIRVMYLPEMVIAYQSALHSAGYLQSRIHFLQCLDLAKDVAKNDSLIECVKQDLSRSLAPTSGMKGDKVQSVREGWGDDGKGNGRLKELVHGFASVSKAILILNEKGTNKGKLRGRNGETLAIWDVEIEQER